MNRRVGAFAVALVIALSVGGTVEGSLVVLDTPGQSATINGVVFWLPDPGIGNIPSGTGAFLRFKETQDGQESGFNTTYTGTLAPPPDDVVTSLALATSDIPQLSFGGTTYREFLFSLQENDKSIDLVELKLAAASSPSVQDFTALTTSFDILSGDTIRLGSIGPGTNIDMVMYVPSANPVFGDNNVVMYNLLNSASDGPDEWAVNIGGPLGTIPEPSSVIVWSLLGALGLTVGWRPRTRKRA